MLLSLALVALMADPSEKLTAGEFHRHLTVDGLERDFLVHVPGSYDGSRPTAVVLLFHGATSNSLQMARFCGMNGKADKAGFIAVYPNGTGRAKGIHSWNAGDCCGYPQRIGVDDVAFVEALLDDLAKVANLDPDRIYASGMSNGGMFSYLLADRLSDRIAAIAPVGGTMAIETCAPKRPVPVLHFHGTDDRFVPFEGGVGERSISRVHFRSVEYSIAQWVAANGCPATPVASEFPTKVQDGTKVTRKVYGPGKEGSEVVLITIEGAGHTWPGQSPILNFLGNSTANISANDLIWEFFEKHPRK